MNDGNSFTIIFIAIFIFSGFIPFLENILACQSPFDLEIIDVIWTIVCSFLIPIFLFSFFYTTSTNISKEDITLKQPINNSTCVSISAPDRWGNKTLTYIDDKGKEASLEIGEDTEIYHKDGKQSKIKYIQKDYYTVINHKISSEIIEVTIYEKK